MKRSKIISIKYRVGMAFFALMLPVVIFLGVYVSSIISSLNKQVAQGGLATLKLYCTTLENEMNHAESFMIDTALNNSSFRALDQSMKNSDAYLKGYAIKNMFTSIISADSDISCLLVYSLPNDLCLTEYGSMKVNSTVDRVKLKDQIQMKVVALLQSGPLNAEKWFIMKIGDHQFYVRAVRYHTTYFVCLIDLNRMVDIAPVSFNMGGSITFFYGNKLLIQDADSMDIEWKQLDTGYYMAGGMKQQYLVMQQTAKDLQVSYVVPYQGVWYLSVFQVMFIAFAAFVILTVPVAWLYLRRNFFYPLNALVVTMEKIKKGDLTAHPDDAYKSLEFKQVNETFNSMIQEITNLKIDSYEKKLTAERAELNALKMQIRPHFFLNCLKSLYALAEAERMKDIQKTILCLADHLRYVFTNKNDTVPLEKELQLCINYVELQNISKVIPMECKLDVDANLMQFPVPPVSLLTFVENSVKYGFRENQPLIIQICVKRLAMESGNLVNITFGDNGPGFSKELLAEMNQNKDDVQVQVHVGLANTIRRFRIVYGSEFAYAFTNKSGAKIDLFIPDKKESTNEAIDC